MTPRQKIVTTVYLDRTQIDRLRAISHETGAPVAHLIRRAVDALLGPQQAAQQAAQQASEP